MLIVLEGSDGAGKTTLAEKLAEALPGPVGRQSFRAPTGDPLQEYESFLRRVALTPEASYIVDRMHWSEMVYGTIFRPNDHMSEGSFRHLEMVLQGQGGLTVLLDPPAEELRQRLHDRGDDPRALPGMREEDVVTVKHQYRWLVDESGLVFSPVHRAAAPNVRAILELAHFRELKERSPFPHYVGPMNPHILLVGDQPNPPDHWNRFAFYPHSCGCGSHLMRCLPGRWQGRVGMVNANEPGYCVRDVWETHSRQARVIALGKEAHRSLKDWEIPHAEVPHPQWARRFNHHDTKGYERALLAAFRGGSVSAQDLRRFT